MKQIQWQRIAPISLAGGVLAGIWFYKSSRARAQQESQEIVDHVDLRRLMGTWYEIARFPNLFQKEDWVGATDNYYPQENGEIEVIYRYHEKQFDAPLKEIKAKMWREPKDAPSGKFKYQALWPFTVDYWVIELGTEYEYLVIGYPNHNMLWIMSRTPSLDEGTYRGILERVANQGYDVSKLIKVPQPSHARAILAPTP